MPKQRLACDFCGREVFKYSCNITAHNFCSRKCLADYSSKDRNPNGYTDLKDLSGMAENMRRINHKMNPERMTDETRAKLRKSRLGKGNGKSYEKTYGRHTHRVVAEAMLGRPLRQGEVVHHIDENKRNNDPDNLMIFSSQKYHALWHAFVKEGDAQ